MEGMISKEVLAIQSRGEDSRKFGLSLENWSAGLVTKLLEMMHGQ